MHEIEWCRDEDTMKGPKVEINFSQRSPPYADLLGWEGELLKEGEGI